MGFVTEACKQRIRERVPLEELVREYNVQLKPSGRKLKGLCPFHAEKTPSFWVDVEKQFYHCFGCHAGGDLFSFVKSMHHVDYPEALEILGRRAGISLEYDGAGKGSVRGARDDGRVVELYDAHVLARDFYHRFLLEDPAARPAREYLRRRGIDAAMWERFHIGFSPPEWDSLLRLAQKRGVGPELLERAGLARRREQGGGAYDYFRGRVMFPITDPQDRVIGFGARTLGDEQPKYLNTPKTPIFDKSHVLYAFPQARSGIHREGMLAVVEGYTDAIMAHQAGMDYFVASLGTAFTQDNARRLGRLAPRAVLIFDGDDAGQRASERSLDLLVAENLDVRIYTVKDGKDPCDAILALGGAEFRRKMESESVGIFEFKWRRTLEAPGVKDSGPGLRARALDEFLVLLARVPNIVARKLYLREFSERIGLAEEDIEARMKTVGRRVLEPAVTAAGAGEPGAERPGAARPGAAGPGQRASNADGPDGRLGAPSGSDELERVVLECVLALPQKAKAIWAFLPPGFFRSAVARGIAGAIERQLEAGDFSAARLAREAEDSDLSRALSGILCRLEDDEGNPSCDYEEVWLLAQRDLERYRKRTKVDELRKQIALESGNGKTERLAGLRKDYLEVLKEMKRG